MDYVHKYIKKNGQFIQEKEKRKKNAKHKRVSNYFATNPEVVKQQRNKRAYLSSVHG